MPTPPHPQEPPPTELRSVRGQHLVVAAVLGVSVGALAVAFQAALTLVSNVQGLISESFTSPATSLTALIALCSGAGALAGLLTSRFAQEAGGSGIPHVKVVLAQGERIRGLRVLFVKFLGGALVIGNRFSLGREGPTIHLGAALAEEISKASKAPPHLREHLIACGAGAGLAAAFNAPLAGFLFVIEELRRGVSSITLGMALLGTVLADSVVRMSVGSGPLLFSPEITPLSFSNVPSIIFISLGAAVAGLLFNQVLVGAIKRTPRSAPLWLRGALVGIIVGCTIRYLPSITDDIQVVCESFLRQQPLNALPLLTLTTLFALKLMLTVACYATGVPGGIFAPMLVQGVFVGLVFGALSHFLPGEVPHPTVCALLGMTALFAASVRAPFTGVVLLAEMTDGFALLLPLMTAALVSYLVAELSGSRPIYERLLDTTTGHRA